MTDDELEELRLLIPDAFQEDMVTERGQFAPYSEPEFSLPNQRRGKTKGTDKRPGLVMSP